MLVERCPDAGVVRRMLLGELSGAAASALEEHFTCCERCLRLAEELSEDGLAQALRAQAALPPDPDHAVADELMERLLRLPLPAAGRPGQAGKPDHDPEATTDDAPRESASRAEMTPVSPGAAEGSGSLREVVVRVEAPPPRPADRVGERIAGYEILGVLGRGGMGVVYKARQAVPDRVVALKMVLSGGLNEDEVRRLRAEGEAAARLDHPGIVSVFEVGEHEGHPFFSMAYVDGKTLAHRLQGGPLPAREAAELITAVAEAVAHAHERGVIHRDLKPGNILVGADGRPRVSDFGLARKIEGDSGLTRSGAVVGTPEYMAPEQATAQKTLTTATDVHGLGTILYALLTGRPPFRAETVLETLEQVVGQEPQAPRTLNTKVPRDLETICLKCLRKEPHNRYPGAAALAEDLRRFQDGRPIEARPVSAWERALKWARRRPVAAALVAVSLLGLLSLAFGGLAYAGYQDQLRRVEVQKLNDQLHLQYLRNNVQEGIHRGQDALDRGDLQKAHDELSKAREVVRLEEKLAEFAPTVDRLLTEADRRQDEQTARDRARAEKRKRYPAFEKARNQALFCESQFTGLDLLTTREGTRQAARQALDLFGRGSPVTPADWALDLGPEGTFFPSEREDITTGCYELLLILAEAVAQPLPSEDSHRQAAQALQLLDRAAELRSPTRAYHARRAQYLTRRGDEAGARVERGREKELKPADAVDFFLLGDAALRRNHLAEAVTAFQEAVRRRPNHFWAHYLSAVCYFRSQRPDLAANSLNACQGLQPEFEWVYILRGVAYAEMGARALKAGRRAEASLHFIAAEKDFRTAEQLPLNAEAHYALLVNRGAARIQQHNYAKAVQDLQAAIRLKPDAFHAYSVLAKAYQEQKDPASALAQLNKAVERQGNSALLYHNRGQVRCELRDLTATLPVLGASTAGLLGSPFGQGPLLAASALIPGRTSHTADLYAQRGWTYLVREAPGLALHDFEDAIRLDSGNGDAYNGRGYVRATRGEYQKAVADAEKALELGPKKSRTTYNAARVYARAAADPRASFRYAERAVDLLHDALALQHPGERARFWQDTVLKDSALRALHGHREFLRLAAQLTRDRP